MRLKHGFLTAFLLVAMAPLPPLSGADIEVEETPVPANSFAVAKYKLEKGDEVIWEVTPKPSKVKEYKDGEYSYVVFSGPTDKYTILAFIVNFDKKKFERKRYENLGVLGCVTPPKPKDPPTTDPPTPPTGKYYFLIIRPDGPASPEFTKVMLMPEWQELRTSGHQVGARTLTEVRNMNLNLDGAVLPVVVTLRVDNNKTTQLKMSPLPTTSEGISKLPEGVK